MKTHKVGETYDFLGEYFRAECVLLEKKWIMGDKVGDTNY